MNRVLVAVLCTITIISLIVNTYYTYVLCRYGKTNDWILIITCVISWFSTIYRIYQVYNAKNNKSII